MKFKGLGKESAKMLWNKIKAELFNKSVTDVEVSGRTMTITKGDGSTSTQTTQDTTYGVVSKSASVLHRNYRTKRQRQNTCGRMVHGRCHQTKLTIKQHSLLMG